MGDCIFCRIGLDGLSHYIPSKDGLSQTPCNRFLYDDSYCIAVLAPEQYSPGHTLVILKQHRDDITSPALFGSELQYLLNDIHNIAVLLKSKLGAERIYIASLCDGIQHLHFHLIPRYKNDKTGFQFMGDLEKGYYESPFYLKPDTEKVKLLEDMAKFIRGENVTQGYSNDFKCWFVQEYGMPVSNFRKFI